MLLLTNSELTMLSDEEKVKFSDSHSIVNYLVEHTGVLFTCISAMIAVLSFIFKYAVVLYHKSYLDYWNIDTAYIASKDDMFLYTIFSTFVYVLLLVLFNYIMNETVIVFEHYNKYLSYLKHETKELKKQLKLAKKQLKAIKKQMRQSNVSNIEKLEIEKTKQEKIVSRIGEKMPYIKSNLIKAHFQIFLNVILTFFLSYVVINIATNLVIANSAVYEYPGLRKAMFIMLFGVFILYFIPALFSTRWKKVSKDEKFIEYITSSDFKFEDKKFPIQFLLHPDKNIFTNKLIIRTIAMLLILPILMLPVYRDQGLKEAKNKEKYQICLEYDKIYAAVYNNGESIILEEAIITDNKIKIYTNRQKIVASNNITYEVRRFLNQDTIVFDLDGSVK